MKKFLIKCGMILTAVCLVCAAGIFAACGEEPNGEKVAYSVTVLDPAGEPLKGVKVKWGDVKTEYPTLETGKATANLAGGEYDIALSGLPVLYKYTPVKATASDKDKTITLEWNPEAGKIVYTVKVLYPDGTPVKGVSVELCVLGENGACHSFPVATNGKGEAYSMGVNDEEYDLYLRGLDAGEYEGKIVRGLPAGYTYDQDSNGYYTGGTATASSPTLTITLKAA